MSRDDEQAAIYENPANLDPIGRGVRQRRDQTRLSRHTPVRFRPETVAKVRQLADEDGLSVSAWIRAVVDREVDRRAVAKSETTSSDLARELLRAIRLSAPEGETRTRVDDSAELRQPA
jgi:hypothetical protein